MSSSSTPATNHRQFFVAMEISDLIEPPQKRLKTEDAPSTEEVALPAGAVPPQTATEDPLSREIEVGITEFVSAGNEGFAGILKKRY